MNANISTLPPALKNLCKIAFPKARKVLVLCVGPSQSVTDGMIQTTLGNAPVAIVPYHEGGGVRTAAKAYTVTFFGGGQGLFIVRPDLPGFPYSFTTDEQIMIAAEAACETL